MSAGRRRSRRWKAAIAAFFFAVCGYVGVWFYYQLGEHYWIFKNRALSTLGKTEQEAREIMGKPKFELTPEQVETKGIDAPWAGMNYAPIPTHAVHNRVLLYPSAWSAAYIFIGSDGRVEYVATAGT